MGYTILKNGDTTNYGIKHIIVDKTTDLNNINTIMNSGSTIQCSENGKTYIINSEQKIKEKTVIEDPSKDATATAEDIILGKTAAVNGILITGTSEAIDTSGATATAADIAPNKTAYVNGELIIGASEAIDTSDATATAADIAPNKTAYVDGELITGTSEAIDTSSATATAADITLGKTAAANGTMLTGTNDYIKPTKGVIFDDWDADGLPHSMSIVGLDYIDSDFFKKHDAAPPFYQKIESIPENSLTGISKGTFGSFTALKNINLENVTAVRNYAFYNCKSLEQVVFHKNISQLYYCFSRCSSLKRLIFLANVGDWSQPFSYGSDTVSPVELYDFSHCTSIFSMPSNSSNYLPHVPGCVIRIPAALSDTTLGDGNGWESATNWIDLTTDCVWEVV